MANIFDVAKYILNTIGIVSTMKLQKLCFYSQAINLAKGNDKLFTEPFEAWANGPVSRDLFNIHKGKFMIGTQLIQNKFLTNSLTKEEIQSINNCIDKYGSMEASQLSDLSHSEEPWNKARGNTPEGINCRNKISIAEMTDFYSNQLN